MQEKSEFDATQAGRQIIRELMGDEYLERRDKSRTAFSSVVQDFADEVCFGRVWARPGIDPKLRSILNVAMLVALNRQGPLRTHVEGALNSGWTVDELQEVLLHTAVYCGLPAAVEAFKVAEEVLKTRKPMASD
jgi:4-carboxymuconolactone decarboxylase